MTNAETLYILLEETIENGQDEEGYPRLDYETIVQLTTCLACPYTEHKLCALNEGQQKHPDAYVDCDDCKAHWLMEEWRG